jgi:hypothetical protein
MVAAMFLGMAVLGLPAGWALSSLGSSWSELHTDAPAVMLLLTMTVPMAGWMAHRRHGWRASAEMSASMFPPAFAVMGLLWVELVTDIGAPLVIEHVAMLLCMLAAMLLRAGEYGGHHRRHREVLSA